MKTMANSKLRVLDVTDSEELAYKAVDIFVGSAEEAISQRGIFYAAISGGRTPHRFYELLAEDDKAFHLPWDRIQLFWVDERCVGPDSPQSNYKLASDTFLKTLPVVWENVHRISGEKKDYVIAVQEYEEKIRAVFGLEKTELPEFDLMILGMGSDGHIGSLLPNSYALFDTDDIVSVVYQMEGGLDRITLTHPVMCKSKKLVVMISGSEKAQIVREVLLGGQDEVKYPAHTLWPILDKVLWIIDANAAKYL